MPEYLKIRLYIAQKYAAVYAYLKTLNNASEYICNLILADMERDPEARFKAALKADLERMDSK